MWYGRWEYLPHGAATFYPDYRWVWVEYFVRC